jgi:hypothetical protein
LIGADFSSIESRVLAWLADEKWKLDIYRKYDETGDPDIEPYCVTASRLLGRKVTPADEAGRQIGKTADLALGFGGGIGAWRKANRADTRGDAEIAADVDKWRRAHPKITTFWKNLDLALKRAVKRPGKTFTAGPISAQRDDVGTLEVTLPSGRQIIYPEAKVVVGRYEDSFEIQYRSAKKGWTPIAEWYGKFVENVVQVIARDLLAAAMLRVEAAGFPVVLHVHDEVVGEISEGVDRRAEFVTLMTALPNWAAGLPVAAKAWCGLRYDKSHKDAASKEEQENDADDVEDEREHTREEAPSGEGETKKPRDNNYSDREPESGKPYAPVRAKLLERGYKLAKTFPFMLPGETKPLFFEDRYEKPAKGKECRFRHFNDGVEQCDTGPRRILYGLQHLVKAGLNTPVFITEGAAKCDSLIAAGLLAVAAPYHTFKDECATALAGRQLIYLEDHDLPDPNGRIAAKEFSDRAQRQLSGLAASFRIVPAIVLWRHLGRDGEPPHGWDVKDWIAAGGKAEKLAGLADQQGAKDSFEVSNAADLQRQEFEATKFIIPGYVAEGVTLFAGKPKIGKSWLALHACWAVATGGMTLGNIQVEQGDVIYAALEDNPRRMKGRMERLFGKTPWPRSLEFVYRMKKLKDGGIAQLRGWIEAKKNPKLVIIDTLKMVRTPAAKGQSYYEADYDAVVELRELAAEFGIAIIVIHHQRKAEADDLFDTVSGTLGLTGVVDTIMIIDKTGTGTILAAKGRDIEEINQAVEFDNGAWRIIGNADFVRVSGERKQILEVMEEAKGEPLSAHQIARAIGGKANSVMKLLHKMAKEGMVMKSGYGKFVLDTGLA